MTEAVAAPGPVRRRPAHGTGRPRPVVFYTDPSAVPSGGARHSDRGHHQNQPQGVLGFHTEDQGGKLWGVVAAKPELDNGRPR